MGGVGKHTGSVWKHMEAYRSIWKVSSSPDTSASIADKSMVKAYKSVWKCMGSIYKRMGSVGRHMGSVWKQAPGSVWKRVKPFKQNKAMLQLNCSKKCAAFKCEQAIKQQKQQ